MALKIILVIALVLVIGSSFAHYNDERTYNSGLASGIRFVLALAIAVALFIIS